MLQRTPLGVGLPLTRAALISLLVALGAGSVAADAAEVTFDGFYRARVRAFDDLSLDRTLAERNGTELFAEHRLWLRPNFFLSDKVSVHVDVRGLDNVPWGRSPPAFQSFGLDAPYFNEDLAPPGIGTDGEAGRFDLSIWRAWGEVDTAVGRFTFGRVPLHWGMGIWQNDGLGLNAEYGDTTDRLQWDLLVEDQVYIRLATDINSEGFLNADDDTYALTGAIAYHNESVSAGFQTQLRRTPSRGFNLVSLDVTFDATLGPVSVNAEVIGQLGSGDLDDRFNDVSIAALGAAAQATLELPFAYVDVLGGFASGDSNPSDARLRAFHFDRDFNVALVMFERPMPTLAAAAGTEANQNQSYDNVLLGNSISNAIFVRPTIGRTIVDGFDVYGSLLLAQAATQVSGVEDRKGYGQEFQLGLRFRRIEHLDIDMRGALFLPGTYFRNYSDETYDSFNAPVFAGQLTAQLRF